MDTETVSFVVGLIFLKRSATVLILAELQRYPFEHMVNISAKMLFDPSMCFVKNQKRDKCIANLCTLAGTCLGEFGLSEKDEKRITGPYDRCNHAFALIPRKDNRVLQMFAKW